MSLVMRGAPSLTALRTVLEHYAHFSQEDHLAIDELRDAPFRECPPRQDLAREGEPPRVVRLIISGWAARYKDLPDGRRQIVGLFIPGDLCDRNVDILRTLDHSIGALTAVRYLEIPSGIIERLSEQHPRLGQALRWHELVASSIQREWLLNIGQRSAYERIAHLFAEMYTRMAAAGQSQGASCDFPMTQTDIANVTGISSVHVNRNLMDLRREGVIEFERRRLTICDWDRLITVAMFDPSYLHLAREGQQLDAND